METQICYVLKTKKNLITDVVSTVVEARREAVRHDHRT